MTSLLTMLTLVASLLTLVQTSPNISPEVRTHVLQLSAQALNLAQAQLAESTSKPTMTDTAPGATPAPTGSVIPETPTATTIDVSFTNVRDTVYATGQSFQILGTLAVKNTGSQPLLLQGEAVGSVLGVAITDDTIDSFSPSIQYLYRGERSSQIDIASSTHPIEVAPGATATIDLRLVNQPGATGHFVLNAGGTQHTIESIATQ